jgi:hypothetical protein
MMGKKVVDILNDFRLWINSLRVYGISYIKSSDRGFIMIELGDFFAKFSSCGWICRNFMVFSIKVHGPCAMY